MARAGRVAEQRARFDIDPVQHRRAVEQFMRAVLDGDTSGLLRFLSPDVTIVVDSGGKAPGIRRPVHTADKVARFLACGARRAPAGLTMAIEPVNGAYGAVLRQGGDVISVIAVDLAGGLITDVYWIANPDKLVAYRGEADRGVR